MTHNSILKKLQNRCPDCGLELSVVYEMVYMNKFYRCDSGNKLYSYDRICTWEEKNSTIKFISLFHLFKGNHISDGNKKFKLFKKFYATTTLKGHIVSRWKFITISGDDPQMKTIISCNRCSWYKSMLSRVDKTTKTTNNLTI